MNKSCLQFLDLSLLTCHSKWVCMIEIYLLVASIWFRKKSFTFFGGAELLLNPFFPRVCLGKFWLLERSMDLLWDQQQQNQRCHQLALLESSLHFGRDAMCCHQRIDTLFCLFNRWLKSKRLLNFEQWFHLRSNFLPRATLPLEKCYTLWKIHLYWQDLL